MREEKEVKEGKEVEEAKEVTEKGGSVAAFFDVDGTLLARPSLERRFFWMLRYRRAIRRKNYLLWMVEAVRLAPRGIATMAQANKMYLRGVHGFCGEDGRSLLAYSLPSDTVSAAGERKKNALRFFPEALEQVERDAGAAGERSGACPGRAAGRPRNQIVNRSLRDAAGRSGGEVDGANRRRGDVWRSQSACGSKVGCGTGARPGAVLRVRRQRERQMAIGGGGETCRCKRIRRVGEDCEEAGLAGALLGERQEKRNAEARSTQRRIVDGRAAGIPRMRSVETGLITRNRWKRSRRSRDKQNG